MPMQKENLQTIILGTLALSAAVLAFIISSQIYQHRPLTTDENSYLFQAGNFIEGRIARPLPDMPEAFFHKMIIMDPKAGWFSRYPPVHPIWLIPGVLLGYPYLMSLVGAAVGILLIGRTARRLDISATFTAALLVISPFYAFMYGSLLSHTSGFVLTAAMLLCYIRWQQEKRPIDAALSGLFWGFLFLNRTYTALLIAMPFGIDASVTFLARRNRETLLGCCSFAGVSSLFVGLYRLYNKVATGSSRMPTFLMYDPSEGLGFGPRHTRGHVVHHSFEQGLQNVWENLVIMDQWVWGITGGLLLVAALAVIGWRKRWSPLMLAAPLFIWGGYVYFWYAGIEHFRPVYFFETMAFLVLAAALGFDRIKRFAGGYPKTQVAGGCTLLIILALAGTPFVRAQSRFFHEHNRVARMVYEHIQSAPDNALVLLEGFKRKPLGENMLNLKGLKSDPLVARWNPFGNDALATLYPDRNIFILGPKTSGLVLFERKDSYSHRILASTTHRQTGADVEGVNGAAIRIANPDFTPGLILFGRYPYLVPGQWRMRMLYSIEQVDPDHPVILEIAADRGQTILGQTKLSGSATNAHADIIITTDSLREIEPRVFYGGTGKVALESIHINQITP